MTMFRCFGYVIIGVLGVCVGSAHEEGSHAQNRTRDFNPVLLERVGAFSTDYSAQGLQAILDHGNLWQTDFTGRLPLEIALQGRHWAIAAQMHVRMGRPRFNHEEFGATIIGYWRFAQDAGFVHLEDIRRDILAGARTPGGHFYCAILQVCLDCRLFVADVESLTLLLVHYLSTFQVEGVEKLLSQGVWIDEKLMDAYCQMVGLHWNEYSQQERIIVIEMMRRIIPAGIYLNQVGMRRAALNFLTQYAIEDQQAVHYQDDTNTTQCARCMPWARQAY